MNLIQENNVLMVFFHKKVFRKRYPNRPTPLTNKIKSRNSVNSFDAPGAGVNYRSCDPFVFVEPATHD